MEYAEEYGQQRHSMGGTDFEILVDAFAHVAGEHSDLLLAAAQPPRD